MPARGTLTLIADSAGAVSARRLLGAVAGRDGGGVHRDAADVGRDDGREPGVEWRPVRETAALSSIGRVIRGNEHPVRDSVDDGATYESGVRVGVDERLGASLPKVAGPRGASVLRSL